MLTPRGWWVLFAGGLLAVAGLAGLGSYSAGLPLVGLTLLAWIAGEWLVFAHRVRAAANGFVVRRQLLQAGRPVPAVWAGSPCVVRVTVSLARGQLPLVLLDDRPPVDHPPTDGSPAGGFVLTADDAATLEYTIRPTAPGVLRFEGVGVRIADLAGLFVHRAFVRSPAEVLVLPPLVDADGRPRAAKRFNTLPPPGVHRLRKPGGGNELLDLREYRPGDPPKTIAWKASARRDLLIVKELETDVPVRCTLFLDASTSARVGPPGETPVARLAAVAAGVAQATASDRDLVGLTVIDDESASVLPPARTTLHLHRITRTLAEAAGRLPAHTEADPEVLARYALPLAEAVYPDLLAADLNGRPFGLYWQPLTDSRWRYLVFALALSPLLLFKKEVLEAVATAATFVTPPGFAWVAFLVIVSVPWSLAWVFWMGFGLRGFVAPTSTRLRRRKQLGAVYATLAGDGPGAVERAVNDDVYFAARTRAFLLAHRTRLPLQLFDKYGEYKFDQLNKVRLLADAVVRAVGRARDNEGYVILADVAEAAAVIGPLARAVRAARARRHQVVVILPWPAGVPTAPPVVVGEGKLKLGGLVKTALAGRLHRSYGTVKAELTRAGAAVVAAEDGDAVRAVLARLDRARGTRVRR